MRTARGIASALALLVVCAAGVWAAPPAEAPKAPQDKPEIAKELKAMRIERLELMKARIEVALLRAKEAPADKIKDAQQRAQTLQARQRKHLEKFRSEHPQAARRLHAARQGAAAGRMSGRGQMRQGMQQGMTPRQGWMAPQSMRQGMGPQDRMQGHGMRQGWMNPRGMRQGMGPQGMGQGMGSRRGQMAPRGMAPRQGLMRPQGMRQDAAPRACPMAGPMTMAPPDAPAPMDSEQVPPAPPEPTH